jgi:hypothetical protein
MTRLRRLVVVLGLAAAAVIVQAQPPAPDPPRAPVIRPDGTIEVTAADGHRSTVRLPARGVEPPAPPAWVQDAETQTRFLQALRAMYVSHEAGFAHRTRVFEWQLFSARLIFATVLLLVATGMVFAAIQFRAGFRGTGPDAAAAAPRDIATQVELAATSVKVSSPVLGVVILVISLAFFYLYLVYVYPIAEIG